jgi:hypothetical protein
MAIHYGLPMSSYRPAFEDALRVFMLQAYADLDYMERRIHYESAEGYGVADLKA